ncbi:MAG: hypothetical protein OXG37_00225 [Actinomycetia bacterium]|nr:hypothetical protein [Actinomycetes bacterium]
MPNPWTLAALVLAAVGTAIAVAALIVGIVALGGDSDTDAPTKAAPRAYTVWLVEQALARYERDGAEATLDYYNSPEALDGPWYVFVIEDRDGALYSVANSNRPDLVGTTYERIDANGYDYGAAFAETADGGAGQWVTYLFTHPVTRQNAPKHTWIVRRGEFLFGAGWYEGIN